MNPDVVLFRWINIDLGWEGLAPLMRFMSTFEYFIPVILILAAWMAVRDGVRGRITVLALLLLVPVTDQVSSHVIKPLVDRPRPCRPEAGIEGVRTHGWNCSGAGSFPSSHATNIGGAAMLLALRYRRVLIPAVLIAFLVGYSRVYLGVHYPLDVLAGWCLGGLLGWAAFRLARRGDRRWGRGGGVPG